VPVANLSRIAPADVRAARIAANNAGPLADRFAAFKALVESVRGE
jgi:hypothetical protein